MPLTHPALVAASQAPSARDFLACFTPRSDAHAYLDRTIWTDKVIVAVRRNPHLRVLSDLDDVNWTAVDTCGNLIDFYNGEMDLIEGQDNAREHLECVPTRYKALRTYTTLFPID